MIEPHGYAAPADTLTQEGPTPATSLARYPFVVGFVFLNPPFDRYQVSEWMRRLAEHGDGIALLHARTEAEWFEPCWRSASMILFMADRIKFCRPDGSEQPANSGAPPVLIGFGPTGAARLERSNIPGALVRVWDWRDHDAINMRRVAADSLSLQ